MGTIKQCLRRSSLSMNPAKEKGTSSPQPSPPQVCGGEGDGMMRGWFMGSMREWFRGNLSPLRFCVFAFNFHFMVTTKGNK